MQRTVFETAKQTARGLRKLQTGPEGKLWSVLRNRQFLGKKFYRQHPIFFEYHSQKRFFVADFYCHECKLVIEIDGKNHDYVKDYDELRTLIISELDIRVIRFKNEDVENDIEGLLVKLRSLIRNG